MRISCSSNRPAVSIFNIWIILNNLIIIYNKICGCLCGCLRKPRSNISRRAVRTRGSSGIMKNNPFYISISFCCCISKTGSLNNINCWLRSWLLFLLNSIIFSQSPFLNNLVNILDIIFRRCIISSFYILKIC